MSEKQSYYYLTNGYGGLVKYNGKYVIYLTQKSFAPKYEKNVNVGTFQNGFFDHGDCFVANEVGILSMRQICQIGY